MTLLRFKDIQARLRLSKTSLRRMIAIGTFPAGVDISGSGRSHRWTEQDVDAWLEARMQRGKQSK
jgi:predicted DNA-binding transcriptional regulator AlpA